jgi:SAM-dependent methyltransferase
MKVKPIHPFPARMAPEVALRHLQSKRCFRVLDPMVGSGTVAKIAQSLGHRAIGCDTDPLALMITEAWCRPVSRKAIRRAADRVLSAVSGWESLPAELAYPRNCDSETKKFVRYWFDLKARRQLSCIVAEIRRVRSRAVRLYLLTAVSRTIIVKDGGVSLAKDVAHSRPHKVYKRGPVAPIKAFSTSIQKLLNSLEDSSAKMTHVPQVRRGDARSLPFRGGTVDVVMTSPPYLNAIDYLRGHKLALVWFGHSVVHLRTLRSGNIGSESGAVVTNETKEIIGAVCSHKCLTSRQERMLARYVEDVTGFISEIYRVLRNRGRCVLVVGDCNLRGVYVRNSLIMILIARKSGFHLLREYRRRIPASRRYLPPPGARFAGAELGRRMRTEVVLVFSKRRR